MRTSHQRDIEPHISGCMYKFDQINHIKFKFPVVFEVIKDVGCTIIWIKNKNSSKGKKLPWRSCPWRVRVNFWPTSDKLLRKWMNGWVMTASPEVLLSVWCLCFYRNHLCRSKVYCRTAGDRQGELHDLLEKLVTKSQKLSDSSVSLYYFRYSSDVFLRSWREDDVTLPYF